MKIILTDSTNEDYVSLTEQLDGELESIYGEMQKKYHPLNQSQSLNQVVLIYMRNRAVACGAYKELTEESAELKRIFVLPDVRGRGISKRIVQELEADAQKSGYREIYLETGSKQQTAVSLYQSCGYELTENYGPYVGDTNSICMKKTIK